MREGISGTKNEAYFGSYYDSPGQGYTVYFDASKDGLGCVLMQSGRVMTYGSRKLKNHK